MMKASIGVILICLFVRFRQVHTSENSSETADLRRENATNVLNALLGNMDARVRPRVLGPPVRVKCGFYVISFGSISEMNMEYTMDIYMRQSWMDKRLSYDGKNNDSYITLNSKSIDKVWIPDIFFPNEKSASFHTVTVPNKLMKVFPNGTIVFSVRLTLTLSCPMVLTHFPMDYQQCNIKLESYAYELSDMVLEWFAEGAVEVSEQMELPQFNLQNYETTSCFSRYKTGDFPCLKAKFHLKRQFGFYLLQTYIPTILIVILSWVSFWINMDAVPARISLGVTTVLTMATQLSSSRASIPRVSYPKAIDVWMAMCMTFVFGSLVEYAFVNVLARKNTNARYKKTEKKEDADVKHPKEPENEVDGPTRLSDIYERRSCNSRHIARLIDKVSRIFFPGSFIAFNIVYWSVYTQPH